MTKGAAFHRLLVVVLFFIVAIYAASWFMTKNDEDLSPDAAAWLSAPAEARVAPEENAHYYLLGFNAPEGGNPEALGLEISKANGERMAQGDLTPLYSSSLVEVDRLAFLGVPLPFDEAFIADEARVRDMAADNVELMHRYQVLVSLPHLQPGPDSQTMVHDYAEVLKCHAMRQALFVLDAMGEDPAGAIADLSRETAFWRMTAAESGMLLFKILAKDVILGNYSLLLKVANARPEVLLDGQSLAQARAMTEPATAEELDWTPIYTQRFRDLARILDAPPALGDLGEAGADAFGSTLAYAFLRPLLAKNTTLNIAQAIYACRARAASLPSAMDGAYNACDLQLHDYAAWGMASLNNPFGRRMLLLAEDSYRERVREFHVRENLLPRMLRAWIEMLVAGVDEADAQAFLTELPETERDPFTGLPFHYDADGKALTATGVTLPIVWPQTPLTGMSDSEPTAGEQAPAAAPEAAPEVAPNP